MTNDADAPMSLPERERDIAIKIQALLRNALPTGYVVSIGKSLLYKIEVNAFGNISPDRLDGPLRGQYAFQTDVLIEKQSPAIPLVVIELKYRSFSTHDVITYSSRRLATRRSIRICDMASSLLDQTVSHAGL